MKQTYAAEEGNSFAALRRVVTHTPFSETSNNYNKWELIEIHIYFKREVKHYILASTD
jgi:hypothetical protein